MPSTRRIVTATLCTLVSCATLAMPLVAQNESKALSTSANKPAQEDQQAGNTGALIGVAPLDLTRSSTDLTYWFHPAHSACPAYFFNPNVSGDAARAQKSCESANGSCVQSQGSAGPAC